MFRNDNKCVAATGNAIKTGHGTVIKLQRIEGDQELKGQTRIGRRILYNAGNFNGELILKIDGFTQPCSGPKIFSGQGFSEYDRIGFCECRTAVTSQPFKIKYLMELVIGKGKFFFNKSFLTDLDKAFRLIKSLRAVFQFGKCIAHGRQYSQRNIGIKIQCIQRNTVSPASLLTCTVVVQFISHHQKNDEAGKYTDAEAEYIEKSKIQVPPDISKRAENIVLEHLTPDKNEWMQKTAPIIYQMNKSLNIKHLKTRT